MAEYKKMLLASWKKSATLSAAWGAVVGAMSLIMNAFPELTIILLVLIIPISLLVPAIIGFISAKNYSANSRIELKAAAASGAVSGVVYAAVMIAIALAFIIFNYAIASLVWGFSEGMDSVFGIAGQGAIVAVATLLLGLPILAIIGAISGAIGGAVYSSIGK